MNRTMVVLAGVFSVLLALPNPHRLVIELSFVGSTSASPLGGFTKSKNPMVTRFFVFDRNAGVSSSFSPMSISKGVQRTGGSSLAGGLQYLLSALDNVPKTLPSMVLLCMTKQWGAQTTVLNRLGQLKVAGGLDLEVTSIFASIIGVEETQDPIGVSRPPSSAVVDSPSVFTTQRRVTISSLGRSFGIFRIHETRPTPPPP